MAGSSDNYDVDDLEEAKRNALRLLSNRLYTRHALERQLVAQGYSMESIDMALTDLQESGKQSDLHYAETFARYKWRTSKWSPTRIRMALKQKGVSMDDINVGVGAVFGENVFGCESADDIEDSEDSYDWMEQLKVAARVHWDKSALQTPEVRRRRMVQWLMRRGHQWDVVRDVVDELEDEARRNN
eukprot:CAMPEP_0118930566 /NCGR_PEP_ID=MMETSP1169-20130426/7203_1 /TAXON_ID=36882 /ORGANISM="Pyramimonas obovata, Strain CCMP722" /LENGTH=185 /DNA_ID=CAMNT_0006872941 /DNA_START=487 /DNA_END=1044 /DNA_ORIENTATION=-